MKRNPARGAFFNTAEARDKEGKVQKGKYLKEFRGIYLHRRFASSCWFWIIGVNCASIHFCKRIKDWKIDKASNPQFLLFFLKIGNNLESLENCKDGLKFIFCSKWIGYWPISLWKGRAVHFVAEDWTFTEIDREMVPKLSNTTSLKALDIFQKETFCSYRYKALHIIVVHLLSVSRWIGGIFFVRIHLANRLPLRWKVKSLIQF